MKNSPPNSPRLGWCALSVFLLFVHPVRCNAGEASARNAKNQDTGHSAEAVRVERAPKLDGTLDDPLWQSAKVISDFRQQEPNEGEPATEKTEVRIFFTRHAVYFGIHCYDSQPSRIIATEIRRDVSQDLDDRFEILIDSNHDRRGGYVFEVNPRVRKPTVSSSRNKATQMEATSTAGGTEYGPPRHASRVTDGRQQYKFRSRRSTSRALWMSSGA